MAKEQQALIGLGANLGDPRAAFAVALDGLDQQPGIRVLRCSSLYASQPVQADGPDYINAAVLLAVQMAPLDLLDLLQVQEQAAGRTRIYHHAPRTLDLDLLLVSDQVLGTSRLTLPHPRMHLRRFVIEPAFEVWPDAVIPGRGPLSMWRQAVTDQVVRRIEPDTPWYPKA